ncbi:MAG: hypothetical protein AAGA62_13230, partial [Bacteroidota bacterium]
MMTRLLSLLCIAFLLAACNNGPSAAEIAAEEATAAAQEQAYETMMEAHDRVMPLMGQITASQRSVMEELKEDELAEDRKELLTAISEQLEDANDGMMEWMGNLKPLDELRASMGNDAIMTYVQQEAADIAKVETAMTTA